MIAGVTFFVVLILGFIVHQDIKQKQHEELKLLIQEAKTSIENVEKNKNYYAPKEESSFLEVSKGDRVCLIYGLEWLKIKNLGTLKNQCDIITQ